jgi:hypothetical protein
VLVYIVPNQNVTGLPTLPSHTGTGNTFHFTGAPIATILDSALTACGANENCTGTGQNFGQINLNVSDTLPAGEYWLGLENVPGGGNSTATAKLVKLTPALSGGIGNAGQLDFNQNAIVGPGSPNTYSAADGGPLVYGVMIATPEPASLAILGAAMAGLGVMRRRHCFCRTPNAMHGSARLASLCPVASAIPVAMERIGRSPRLPPADRIAC